MGDHMPRIGSHTFTDLEAGLHLAALTALQILASADVEAVVYRNDHELFIEARPGNEVRILTELSLADWGAMVRAVEGQ